MTQLPLPLPLSTNDNTNTNTTNGWRVLGERHEFYILDEVRGTVTYHSEWFEPWRWTATIGDGDSIRFGYAGTAPSLEEAKDAVEYALNEE